jgi:ribosome-binding protein aMBF1 (putative translation factor)
MSGVKREAICGHPMRRYETPRRGGVPDYLMCGRRPGHPGRHESTLYVQARRNWQPPTGSAAIADALRRARGQAGLSQVRLAAIVGVSPSAVQMWEEARRTPRGENWVQLELTLGPLGVVREARPEPEAATRADHDRAA